MPKLEVINFAVDRLPLSSDEDVKDEILRNNRYSRLGDFPVGLVVKVVPAHEDDRRAIVEDWNGELDVSWASTKLLDIHKAPEGERMELGNHYHAEPEKFFLVDGAVATLHLRDVDTGFEVVFENIPSRSRMYIPTETAHQLLVEEPTLLLVHNEKPYNSDSLIPYDFSE